MKKEPEKDELTKSEKRQILLALDKKEYRYLAKKINRHEVLGNSDFVKIGLALAERLAVVSSEPLSTERISTEMEITNAMQKIQAEEVRTAYWANTRIVLL